jgi:hypothetical protein
MRAEAVLTFTKFGVREMPAVASTIEERSSVIKSVDTTASSVNLQAYAGAHLACQKSVPLNVQFGGTMTTRVQRECTI